jgi:hypothetical protein
MLGAEGHEVGNDSIIVGFRVIVEGSIVCVGCTYRFVGNVFEEDSVLHHAAFV